MLSSTFELILIAASNSHILFCFCNLIIAILLLESIKPSSEENNNIMKSHKSKRRELLDTSKLKHSGQDMNLDFEVRKMDTACVSSSQDLCTFAKFEQSHQDTKFKCEIVEVDPSWHDTKVTLAKNGSIDRTMHLAKMKKKTSLNNFERSDEKEEDELRKRTEDFIEKTIRGWRAEKFGMYYQSQ